MDAIGLRLYELNVGPVAIVDRERIKKFLRDASQTSESKYSLSFLLSEWEQVVDAWQLDSWEEYRDVVRLGRKTRLPEKQRFALWATFEQARTALQSEGLITKAEMFTKLALALSRGGRAPFDFSVVDEAQDLNIAQLRFLAAMAAKRVNALFFAGDLGQRIFQHPFSWKALGVDVRGRSLTLKIKLSYLAPDP